MLEGVLVHLSAASTGSQSRIPISLISRGKKSNVLFFPTLICLNMDLSKCKWLLFKLNINMSKLKYVYVTWMLRQLVTGHTGRICRADILGGPVTSDPEPPETRRDTWKILLPVPLIMCCIHPKVYLTNASQRQNKGCTFFV